MQISQINTKYLIFIFCLVFFFPLLPTVFQSSQVHINAVIILFCILPLLLQFKLELTGLHAFVFLYYLCCQCLLIPSALNDLQSGILTASSIFSFLRPILLYVSYLGILLLLEKCELKHLISTFKVIIVISFAYVICEIFLIDIFKSIVYLLYKREFRLNLIGVGTTFFGTSYYSGFAFFSLFVLLAAYANSIKSKGALLIAFMAIIVILLSQSKTAILALLIAIMFFTASSANKYLRFCFYSFVLLSFIVILNLESIFDYLAQFNLTIFKQLKILLFSTSKSDTLNARTSQISMTLSMLNDNWGLLGVGLTPSKSLESWIALFLYRYGAVGIFTFLSLCLVTAFYSIKVMRSEQSHNWVGKAGLIWALTLPITQMSTPMIEISKMGFISNFILALITVYHQKVSNGRIQLFYHNPVFSSPRNVTSIT